MQNDPQYRILIVDDDSDIREMLALILHKSGYNYETAKDGTEALAYCARESFDIILLDIMMPDTDGYVFCTALRRYNKQCFIIFITALDGPEVLEKALLLGGDDFIRKPFEPRELLARITSCLRRLDTHDRKRVDALLPIHLPDGAQLLPDKNAVYANGQTIRFTPIETSLLHLLVSHPHRRFTYAELYESVWKTSYLDDKGTVATFIYSIKKKLKDARIGIHIATVWGEGYYYQPEPAE